MCDKIFIHFPEQTDVVSEQSWVTICEETQSNRESFLFFGNFPEQTDTLSGGGICSCHFLRMTVQPNQTFRLRPLRSKPAVARAVPVRLAPWCERSPSAPASTSRARPMLMPKTVSRGGYRNSILYLLKIVICRGILGWIEAAWWSSASYSPISPSAHTPQGSPFTLMRAFQCPLLSYYLFGPLLPMLRFAWTPGFPRRLLSGLPTTLPSVQVSRWWLAMVI